MEREIVLPDRNRQYKKTRKTAAAKQTELSIFIVAPCILFQFTKKIQQMHLKSILKNTH
jgi:hypothetical protein